MSYTGSAKPSAPRRTEEDIRGVGCHNAIEIISHHFPSGFVVALFVMQNMVINNTGYCEKSTRTTVIALIIIVAILACMAKFVDRYKASDGVRYFIILIPWYGPFSPMLPSDEDKDVVDEHYRAKATDIVLGVASALLVAGMSILTNPVMMCLYPSYSLSFGVKTYKKNGTTDAGGAVLAAGPIFVCLVAFIIFMCVSPKRNGLGKDEVPETCPVAAVVDGDMSPNPAYSDGGSQGSRSIDGRDRGGYSDRGGNSDREGGDRSDAEDRPRDNAPRSNGSMQDGPR